MSLLQWINGVFDLIWAQSKEVFIACFHHDSSLREVLIQLNAHRAREKISLTSSTHMGLRMLRALELLWGFMLLKCGTPKVCYTWGVLNVTLFSLPSTGLFPKRAWYLGQWGMLSGRTLKLGSLAKRKQPEPYYIICADRSDSKLLLLSLSPLLRYFRCIPAFYNKTVVEWM